MPGISRSNGLERVLLLLCVTVALTAASCETCNGPDPDGTRSGAQNLPLERWKPDQLQCRSGRGDCADWYRLRVPRRGDLRVEAVAAHPTGLVLVLTDRGGRPLAQARSGGEPELAVHWHAQQPDVYYVRVQSPGVDGGRLSYQVAARFREWVEPVAQPVQPPVPLFETRRSEVIEVQGQPARPEAVFLADGSGAGVREGMRGRLLNGSTVIAEIEIVEVFPNGCRARLEGSPQEPLTSSTVAEIEVPVARPAAGPMPDADIAPEPESEPEESIPWLTPD